MLIDTNSGQTVLQQFGPSRSYLHTKMLSNIATGRELFDEVLACCVVHHTKDMQASDPKEAWTSADKEYTATTSVGTSKLPLAAKTPVTLTKIAPREEMAVQSDARSSGAIHAEQSTTSDAVMPVGGKGHYHFGIWYGQGGTNVTLSSNLQQNCNAKTTKVLTTFLVWLRMFVQQYAEPLVSLTVQQGGIVSNLAKAGAIYNLEPNIPALSEALL